MILKVVRDFYRWRKMRKILSEFRNEIEKNLEIFYVMDQRRGLSFFNERNGVSLKMFSGLSLPADISIYLRHVEDFNRKMKDFKSLEKRYLSDIRIRTKGEAVKLQDIRERLQGQLKNMRELIKAAKRSCDKIITDLCESNMRKDVLLLKDGDLR